MAQRYSGSLQISVTYDDKNHYRTAVSRNGKLVWRGIVNPAPAGFGPGIAYDSPKAYDQIAASALTFADEDVGDIGDDAEFNEQLTGYLIRRSPRGKTSHATKKEAPKRGISVSRINGRWQPVTNEGQIVRGAIYNANGAGYSSFDSAREAAWMLNKLGTQG